MRQLVKEKENSEFRPVKLRLKIDLVSYPARAEGLVNMIYIMCVCVCLWLCVSEYIYVCVRVCLCVREFINSSTQAGGNTG